MDTATPRTTIDRGTMAREFGARLRKARLAAGLSQQALAEGRYTKAHVSALEKGLSRPSVAALTFFAERLGVSVTRLMGEGAVSWSRLEADLALAAGRWPEAVDAYEDLLGAEPGAPQRAELLLGSAEGLAGLDRGREAVAAAGEAAVLFSKAGRDAEAALARYWLSCGEYQQGNTVEATAILRSVLEKVRAGLRVEPDFEFRLLMALSSNESRQGNHAAALGYLEEIRGLAGRLDDRRRATYLHDLAFSYRETGDHEGAIRAGIASLALFRAAGAESELGQLENDLALSYLAVGNLTKADELAAGARARFERLGDERWLAHILETQAQIALARGAPDECRRLAHEALERAAGSLNEKAATSALLTLARVEKAEGHSTEALAAYERAAEAVRRGASAARLREVLGEWADVLADSGEHQKAFELMREALKGG